MLTGALVGAQVGVEAIPRRFIDVWRMERNCWRWPKKSGSRFNRAVLMVMAVDVGADSVHN
jgi:hypothetical protein